MSTITSIPMPLARSCMSGEYCSRTNALISAASSCSSSFSISPSSAQLGQTIIVKFGGSSITNKSSFETLNREALAKTSSQIAEAATGPRKCRFAIVHGAGNKIRIDRPHLHPHPHHLRHHACHPHQHHFRTAIMFVYFKHLHLRNDIPNNHRVFWSFPSALFFIEHRW